jgi:cytochrome c oxidase subunit I
MNTSPFQSSIAGVTHVPTEAARTKTIFEHLHEWVVTVDHKKLGLMYIMYGLLFLGVAGTEASLMRIQLAVPNNHFLSPQVFNQLFTMHGTTMVFLVGMPLIFGFANYLVPLMIGARDLAFPRLNAFGFWLSVFGGLLLYFSLIGGMGMTGAGSMPDVGWFAYAPLTSPAFSRGHSTDYWTIGVLVGGLGSIATAANIVTTIVCLRCKGMTLMKMPLLVWMNLLMCGMVLMVVSPLTAAQIMLLLDRFLGAHFFDTQAGGSAILWQHFFWIFGHPEVYVLIIPGFAFASEIIPVFSRKAIFGYPVMVGATVAIAFVSFGVWAHHMFTVGMTSVGNTFFAISTMLVGVPTGIKIFNWIGTMWGGKIRFDTPMLFCTAFLFQFLIAGLTGIMLAVVPFDWQLSDSYFVVAHFHFVLVGALLFTIFGAVYYWFPKATGRMLSERLGKWHFWLFVIGFHVTFDTMHIPGMLGMPRRIYTYEAGRGWDTLNMICTVGVAIQAAAILCFVGNVLWSVGKGKHAGNDPWDAWTLEWSTTSPPPEYNFAETPVVKSRRPLWDVKHPTDPDWKYE